MTRQLDLFDVQRKPSAGPRFTAPARAGNEPQQEAARLVGSHVCRQARQIVALLIDRGPMIQEEIEACGFLRSSVTGRVNRLVRYRYVKLIGKKLARSGVHVGLYDVTPAGRQWHKEN